jgi:hypothetical protein
LRNPALVENGGFHIPLFNIIYRVSSIRLVMQDFATIHRIKSMKFPMFRCRSPPYLRIRQVYDRVIEELGAAGVTVAGRMFF